MPIHLVAGSVYNRVNFEPRRFGIQRREHHADAGPDICDDQRLSTGGARRIGEVFVVPGVHFTFARRPHTARIEESPA
jgi:hypothetical protein